MAEALVEIVLEQVVSIIRQQAEEGIRLIAGAEQEVEKLQSNFMAIQAVLTDAENRQVKENTVRVWLDKLKDVSYEIDDVLDEWNTKLQILKIKKAEDAFNPMKKDMSERIQGDPTRNIWPCCSSICNDDVKGGLLHSHYIFCCIDGNTHLGYSSSHGSNIPDVFSVGWASVSNCTIIYA
ncbi:putative disease resistance RPP13-like protein 3 [Pistacia vera]|uniref:putative disease resistance RPP13-like protein 3 n=1 Tax=Pistacia vera TaxID=55513 RepID=UPI0012633F74|nr:putative disease resistance RPP13-like protein 3 [Pistacia vera]